MRWSPTSTCPIFGGLEIALDHLAHELTLRGHEAHVISVTPGGPDEEIFPVHRLDVPRLEVLYRARSRAAVDQLDALLRRGRFDLVHAHCIFSPLAHAATFLARRLGLPSVFTLHSDLRGVGGAALSLLNRVVPVGRWPTVLSAVRATSRPSCASVTARDDVELVLNAAHLDRWQLERQEELRVVSRHALHPAQAAGRSRPHRCPTVLRAACRARSGPGSCSSATAPSGGRWSARWRASGSVSTSSCRASCRGRRSPSALARSALFAVPSRREALSIAAIEARAVGLPVVARIPSGVGEVVEHGVHGLLVRTRDEFVDALVQLLGDPALRARMSAAARQDLERFAWPRCVERHEELYALATARHAR